MHAISLFSGQWLDLALDDFLDVAEKYGFDCVDLVARSNFVSVERAASDSGYCRELEDKLQRRGLSMNAISVAYIGKCVGDVYDVRHNELIPENLRNHPEDVRKWAVRQMLMAPRAAKNLGCSIVHSFLGSPIWGMVYPYPHRREELVEEGFEKIGELWLPILDEFARQGVVLAFEVHPTEIAYDYYTLKKLLEVFKNHPAFRLNFDPSHLLWQGMDPVRFVKEFAPLICNVHIKDVKITLDGASSILCSHLPFGDPHRGWDFRTPGHGDVPFEEIVRVLNYEHYRGAFTIEWEDNGMERSQGICESMEFVKHLNFKSSEIEFDGIHKYG